MKVRKNSLRKQAKLQTPKTLLASSMAVLPLLVSTVAHAGTPSFVDARSLAMGGVGITSARPAASGFFNPALLAIKQPDKRNGIGVLLPSVNASFYDEEELLNTVDDFEDDFIEPFETALDGLETALDTNTNLPQARANLAVTTNALNQELQSIDADQIRVDLGSAASVMRPSETLGLGLFVSGSARVAGQINYDDAAKLNTITQLAATTTDIEEIYDLYDPDVSNEQLDSSVRAVGSAYSQIGVSLARSFEIAGRNYAFGVSPKAVNLIAYDFVGAVDDFETDDIDETEVSESKFNLDLGVATFFGEDNQYLAGLSIINLLPMDIETDPGFDSDNLSNIDSSPIKIETQPKLTAGLSYLGDSFEISTDLELSKTEELFGEGDTQYWGLGAEYDLVETFQLRGGFRYNLASSEDPWVTAGFGLNLAGFTVELAALSTVDFNSVGAGLQFGLTF